MRTGRHILICGVNWLGDACMSMPAIQAYKQLNPDTRITMVTKPALLSLWSLHACIDHVVELHPGIRGLLRTSTMLRQEGYDQAFIFPNSWRSALIAWLARIDRRVGAGSVARRLLLTHPIRFSRDRHEMHQQWEYADIMQLPTDLELPPPELQPSLDATASLTESDPSVCTMGLIPGAARGVSKQWPETHFIEAALQIQRQLKTCRFHIFGTQGESTLCQRIASALQPNAVSLAGQTTLSTFAKELAKCQIVVANDSGGMHLAAAVGTPVVSVFGLTDPRKTGPLGKDHHCLVPAGERGKRRIARNDPRAARALAAIQPSSVAKAVITTINAINGS